VTFRAWMVYKDWRCQRLRVRISCRNILPLLSARINNLVKIAAEENDNAAAITLQWFVAEQVEEEASASKVVHDLEIAGDSGHAILMLEPELATRLQLFTLPTAGE